MKQITEDMFDSALAISRAVLVDFTAVWCPPCHAMKPALERLSAERADVDVVEIDVEQCPQVAERYGVRAMPTLILFRGGSPIAQLVGAQSRERLDAWLDDKLGR